MCVSVDNTGARVRHTLEALEMCDWEPEALGMNFRILLAKGSESVGGDESQARLVGLELGVGLLELEHSLLERFDSRRGRAIHVWRGSEVVS